MTETKSASAMDTAKEALNAISGHVRECDLRYQNIEATQTRIEGAVMAHAAEAKAALAALAEKQDKDAEAMYRLLWGVALGVMAGMFAVIMALVFKA